MNTVHYNVSGLANSESKTKVTNALNKIDGVQKIAVDLARGTIEVHYNEATNPQQIQQCIEHTGYIIN
ncbi:heavy-metal-associated domain-containing protein [Clostridium sp. JNZ J1-5]